MVGTVLATMALLAGAWAGSLPSSFAQRPEGSGTGSAWEGVARGSAAAVAEYESPQGDAADSLYRAARTLLGRGRYGEAAEAYARLRARFPRSAHVADSYYWEAFARSRMPPSLESLRQAWALLRTQAARHPGAATRTDADVLAVGIQGQLARLGDADAAEAIRLRADLAAVPGGVPDLAGEGRGEGRQRQSREAADSCGLVERENGARIAALGALAQSGSAEVLPAVRRLLERRGPCSAGLRRRALFIAATKGSEEAGEILSSAARSDPDPDVRAQAIQWLPQVGTDGSLAFLDSILNAATDADLQRQVIAAIGRYRSPHSRNVLRRYIEGPGRSVESRTMAISALTGRVSGEERPRQNVNVNVNLGVNVSAARDRTVGDTSIAQDTATSRFLFGIARDSNENVAVRAEAVYYAALSPAVRLSELAPLVRQRVGAAFDSWLFPALSQRSEAGALHLLMSVVEDTSDTIARRTLALRNATDQTGQRRGLAVGELGALYRRLESHTMKVLLLDIIASRREADAVDALIGIARTETDTRLRDRAFTGLGRSRDPRAVRFLLDVVNP